MFLILIASALLQYQPCGKNTPNLVPRPVRHRVYFKSEYKTKILVETDWFFFGGGGGFQWGHHLPQAISKKPSSILTSNP